MNESLLVSNVYAAYTAGTRSERNVSELSQMIKGEKVSKPSNEENYDPALNMDKVIISKEALELLGAKSTK